MTDVSFLPDDYKEKRIQRRTNLISLGLFVVVMGSIVGAYFVTNRQREEVRKHLTYVNEQFEEAARRLDQLEELKRRKELILRKANLTSVLIERVPRSLVMAELINRMPQNVALTELRLTTTTLRAAPRLVRTVMDKAKTDKPAAVDELPPMPQMKPTQVGIVLTGLATTDVDVAQYMAKLSRSPMFTELNLLFSQELKVDGVDVRKFSVEMTLDQEVNVEQIEPLRVRRGDTPEAAPGGFTGGRMTSYPVTDAPASIDAITER